MRIVFSNGVSKRFFNLSHASSARLRSSSATSPSAPSSRKSSFMLAVKFVKLILARSRVWLLTGQAKSLQLRCERIVITKVVSSSATIFAASICCRVLAFGASPRPSASGAVMATSLQIGSGLTHPTNMMVPLRKRNPSYVKGASPMHIGLN